MSNQVMPKVRLCVAAALLLFAVSCASAPINKKAAAELAAADADVAEGCYQCLTAARDTYARLAVGKARPLIVQRLFETHVLIGLRLKELALDGEPEFAKAESLARELGTFPAAAYLEIARAVPSDPGGGLPRPMVLDAVRAFTPKLEATFETLPTLPSALLSDYLLTTVRCTVGRPRAAEGRTVTPPPAPPSEPRNHLLAYRQASCAPIGRATLTTLVADEPRWTESGVMVGRVRSTRPGAQEVADARRWLQAAEGIWPASSTVLFALGALHQTRGDCRAAVDYYDKTIALFADHEAAHLGRVMCLSYLRRHDEAIAGAGVMIDARMDEGEARYWRAWNERETNQLAAARVDSDRMKQLLFNDRILTLAGQIEHDMDDLPVAEKDLDDAVRISAGDNCVAAWYAGLVQLKKQAWPATARWFARARECYEGDKAKVQASLDEMKGLTDVDKDWQAGQIANFEAVLKEDDSQMSASAFNAAVNYARAQDRENALKFLELAALDPDRAAQVAELRKLIVK